MLTSFFFDWSRLLVRLAIALCAVLGSVASADDGWSASASTSEVETFYRASPIGAT